MTSPPKRPSAVLWAVFPILLLGGLYFGLQTTFKRPTAEGPEAAAFKLAVSDPRPYEESPVFSAKQGDTVTFLITSDRAGELDVHGYEKKVELKSGGEVQLSFIATESGAFPMHLHEPFDPPAADGSMLHRHLATLEVQPK